MKNEKRTSVQDITITAMMAALVFVGTYYFKIPSYSGYTHLGDCMIILTVCLFGTRKGVLAGAIGAGMADLLGGYFQWIIPTILIKGVWALLMGLIMYKWMPKVKCSWLIGAIAGGLWHIIGYTVIKIPLYGMPYAIARIPVISVQTVCGIVFGSVLYCVIRKSPAMKRLTPKPEKE